jgi:transposase InsO family protein
MHDLIGRSVADNMSESIIINALEKALNWPRPMPGLILHSDRGGQYVSLQLRKMISVGFPYFGTNTN